MPDAPAGLTLHRLEDDPTPGHADARAFCLAVIKEFYGFDYNPDWHADLDALLLPADRNHYSRLNRGAFWTLSERNGTIIATAGIRAIRWKPAIVAAFAERYPEADKIASLWRVYVNKDRRGGGIGTWFNGIAEEEAVRLGYTTMYLHASSDATATVAFWRSSGYTEIGDHEFSTHFDKPLIGVSSARRDAAA
jgi:GNAT superfamily N-acetyltransferase